MKIEARSTLLMVALILALAACKDKMDDTTNPSDDDTSTTEIVYGDNHESSDDYDWDSDDVIDITLNGSSITVDSDNVTVDGAIATITVAANYRITGSLTDGQIVVDTEDSETVRLILAGMNMTSSTTAPLYIAKAEKTIVILEENTENYLSDAEDYVYEDDDDEPDAALFSKDDMTIYGAGTLTVVGNYNEAIKSKDGLIINAAVVNVTSVDDGIQGKDYLIIKGGSVITVNADGDGLKSSNDEDTELGYITMADGAYTIVAGSDAVQAETNLQVTGGTYSLTAGGGSDATIGDDDSAKGLKAGVSVTIDGGTFVINTADDGVHSDEVIVINDGDIGIASGDDGMHADVSLEVNGGTITVNESYEGLESAVITLNAGDIYVVSSDDGINVAGGNDNSGWGGGFSGSSEDDYYLYINGGYIVVHASGDGLDANGSIVMTDGTVIVHGPTASDNAALDYDQTFTISGGLLIAVSGSTQMAQAPSSSSSQYSVSASFSSSQSAGQLFYVGTSGGSELITFAPAIAYKSIVFSSPELEKGSTYVAYKGGSYSGGSEYEGLYSSGTYSGGTEISSFKISNKTTSVSN